MLDKSNKRDSLLSYNDSIMQLTSFKHFNGVEHNIIFKSKAPSIEGYSSATPGSFKLFFWNNVVNYPETF
jgi:hypothetical protein